jgi:hypothetical protein
VRKLLHLAALCALATLAFAPTALAQDLYDCSDFDTQEEAQAQLLPGDPYGLDEDSDNKACEDLPSGGNTMSTPASHSTSPSASPTSSAAASSATSATVSASSGASTPTTASASATASVLAETGGASPLALISIALLIGGGILAAGILRRH